jgi:serine/threonine protein phosphatase 1
MIKSLFAKFLQRPAATAEGRQRLEAKQAPAALYAVGDVHGHLDLLRGLERQILADGAHFEGEKWIVMLGDYIDRGPQSAAVLDHLLAPLPADWRRMCLCGNHEQTMAAALTDRTAFRSWLGFGGTETLMSYGISSAEIAAASESSHAHRRLMDAFIPAEHVEFLHQLPVLLQTPRFIFAHAGLRPHVALAEQAEEDLLWFRGPFDSDFEFGATVVHGHTPVTTPDITPNRINIDTGAYATGVLTGIFLGEHPRVLSFYKGT